VERGRARRERAALASVGAARLRRGARRGFVAVERRRGARSDRLEPSPERPFERPRRSAYSSVRTARPSEGSPPTPVERKLGLSGNAPTQRSALKFLKRAADNRRTGRPSGRFSRSGSPDPEAVTPSGRLRDAQPCLQALLQVGKLERGEELGQRSACAGGVRPAQALKGGQHDVCVLELQASDVLNEPGVKAHSRSPVATRLGAQEHQADGQRIGERDRAQLGRRGADEKRIPSRKRATEPSMSRALRRHEHMFACEGQIGPGLQTAAPRQELISGRAAVDRTLNEDRARSCTLRCGYRMAPLRRTCRVPALLDTRRLTVSAIG
jgi:hypothetical protein